MGETSPFRDDTRFESALVLTGITGAEAAATQAFHGANAMQAAAAAAKPKAEADQ